MDNLVPTYNKHPAPLSLLLPRSAYFKFVPLHNVHSMLKLDFL